MTTENQLLPCPFCGEEPHDAHHIEYGRWAVTCQCGVHGASASTGPNATDESKIKAYTDARAAWNARAAITQRPAAQAGEAFESVLIDGVAYDLQAPVAAELLRLHLELQALPTQPAAQATPAGFMLISDEQIAALEVAAMHMQAIADKRRQVGDVIESVRTINDAAKIAKVAGDRVANVLSCLDLNKQAAQATPEHCQCQACRGGVVHASDCAVHNGPALPVGPCDCGATPEPVGEVVYQIKGDSFECPHAWRDATEEAFYTTPAADRRILYTRALRPQAESEQEKELRRSLAEAQATISERNVEIIELQKRIHRSPQAVPMTEQWRLLRSGERIEAGDEGLQDDCVTWLPLAGWEVGMTYNPTALVPMRRRVPSITAPAGGEKQA